MDHTRTIRPLVVIQSHSRTYPDPIAVTEGEQVAAGERDNPGGHEGYWIWCTNGAGKSGWIPEQFLDIADGTAIALVDCDAIELTVAAGDRLMGGEPVNGWVWCVTEDDDAGWVPVDNLRPAGEGDDE